MLLADNCDFEQGLRLLQPLVYHPASLVKKGCEREGLVLLIEKNILASFHTE
jgi:hypothetical protein